MTRILVTGGAGFIGSHFVQAMTQKNIFCVVLDKLTYAGHRINLHTIPSDSYQLYEGDITQAPLVREILTTHNIDSVIHFAAESHVDRSIQSASPFIHTNIVGTFTLLEESLNFWRQIAKNKQFKFIQVSTDEVFGSLGETGKFNEASPYDPRSPYSASKAAGDHLALSFFHTHHLPVIITHCSNNYGPRQYPEKLIPFMIRQALAGRDIGVYGDGKNVRDWIHVQDHVKGIELALTQGQPGQRYCFGGHEEKRNIDVVETLCLHLDQLQPKKDGSSYKKQIKFIKDRQGHDWRYAIDDTRAQKELGFQQTVSFSQGLRQTTEWYLENLNWMKTILRGEIL